MDGANFPINDLGVLKLPPIFTPVPPQTYPISPNNIKVKVYVVSYTAEFALTLPLATEDNGFPPTQRSVHFFRLIT